MLVFFYLRGILLKNITNKENIKWAAQKFQVSPRSDIPDLGQTLKFYLMKYLKTNYYY